MNFKEWKYKNYGFYLGITFMVISVFGGVFLFAPFFIFMMIADSFAVDILTLFFNFSENINDGNVCIFMFYTMIYLLLLIMSFLIIQFNGNLRVKKICLILFFIGHFFFASMLFYFSNFFDSSFSEKYDMQTQELMLAIPKAILFYPLYGFLFDLLIKRKNAKSNKSDI